MSALLAVHGVTSRVTVSTVPGAALAVALQGEAAEFWPVFWREAGPVLGMIAEVFAGWGKDPASHVELRAAWRRGRSIEMSGG